MKKLLMLCYHYPPAVSGGVERSVRFARHLPANGWEGVVVTTARYGENGGKHGERVLRVREAGFRRRRASAGDGGASHGRGARGSFLRLVEKWLFVPDRHVRWGLAALRPALGLIRREGIDAIYSTSPPESAHVLACALKRRAGIPWIMDLRDPWTLEPLRWYLREGGARLDLERWIEGCAFGLADAVVVNTDEAAAAYRERYPGAAGRIVAIPNGWDAADFEAARGSARAGPGGSSAFRVAHVGTFSRHADAPAWPRAFFGAVQSLRNEGALSERTFRVVLAGAVHPAAEKEIDRLELGGIVERRGRVAHDEALRIMIESDLLLLYDPSPEGRYYIRGKLYEYLAAGPMILGLVPQGATRRLLERSGHGVVVSPDDGDAIRRALTRLIAERSRPVSNADFDIGRYEGAALAAALAGVLAAAIRRDV